MSSGVVIVGGGIAAQSVCEELRERDSALPLTVICGEPCLPYDRVRLSELLVSDEAPAALALRPREWYEDRGVKTLLGRRVSHLDTGLRRLTLDDQEEIPYDQLVLATGSEPLLPPLPGLGLAGVLPFRGPEHCEEIRAAARGGAARVAVIGGGLLGLEAAYGVAAQGCAVTVVHLMDRLMERQLDQPAAALLRPAIEELGVEVLLERQTEA
ncbi:MAG TPA: FAD-dependent oxidoreductase, partial [Solirubrobacterales bacterium]|nr:FAD-dependent oxidoreductase [Solirubrobacterales bacterium]